MQARRSRHNSASPVQNKPSRSNSLSANGTSINEFLELLRKYQSIEASIEPELNPQPWTSTPGVGAQTQSLGSQYGRLMPPDIPRRRRRSQSFDVSPFSSDDEGSVLRQVQIACFKLIQLTVQRSDHSMYLFLRIAQAQKWS